MSLDEHPFLAHRREREHYDAQAEQDWLVEQDVAEHEMSGGAWDAVMAASPAHRSGEYWPDRPGIDRRCFAVDGDLIEDARRDAERHYLPGGDAA